MTATPRSGRTTTLITALAALALAAGLLGCGSESDAESASAPVSASLVDQPVPGPSETMRAWLDATRARDNATVCALGTPAYNQAQTADAVELGMAPAGATCEQGVDGIYDLVLALGGYDLRRPEVEVLDESPDRALVRVTYGGGDREVYRMVRRADGWLVAGEVRGD